MQVILPGKSFYAALKMMSVCIPHEALLPCREQPPKGHSDHYHTAVCYYRDIVYYGYVVYNISGYYKLGQIVVIMIDRV